MFHPNLASGSRTFTLTEAPVTGSPLASITWTLASSCFPTYLGIYSYAPKSSIIILIVRLRLSSMHAELLNRAKIEGLGNS